MESIDERIERFLKIGSGSGSGYGVSNFRQRRIYMIDNVATIIDSVHGHTAKGYILQSDLTLIPCYVAKSGRFFAHGDTLHSAYEAVLDKSVLSQPIDERIASFLAVHNLIDYYPARDLFAWHHRLTGSCELGRKMFCRDRGIDIDVDKFAVFEFISITKNAYGGDVIRALEKTLRDRLSSRRP